jgi:hypothetical protein
MSLNSHHFIDDVVAVSPAAMSLPVDRDIVVYAPEPGKGDFFVMTVVGEATQVTFASRVDAVRLATDLAAECVVDAWLHEKGAFQLIRRFRTTASRRRARRQRGSNG